MFALPRVCSHNHGYVRIPKEHTGARVASARSKLDPLPPLSWTAPHNGAPVASAAGSKPDVSGSKTVRFVGFQLKSVRRFAVRLFGYLFGMMLLAAPLLWLLMSAVGVVDAFEKFMRDIGFSGFHLLSLQFIFGLAWLAAVFAGFVAAMTVVAAGLYNVLASRQHGIELLVTDRSAAPALAPDADPVGAWIMHPRQGLAPRSN